MNIAKEIERELITKYKRTIYRPFRKAIEEYQLIQENDKIAVCISGGKDSMLMAKCFQELKKHSGLKFEVIYLVMNPGYSKENLEKIKENVAFLDIPVEIFDSNIFQVLEKSEKKSSCFLCAKMRRGVLYTKAEELGCNKMALGHHYDDVLETILLNMLYAGEIKTMMPKIHSQHFHLQVIRPMYLIKEESIISWRNHYELDFLNCACRFTDQVEKQIQDSKRLEMKALIQKFRDTSPYIELSLFHSVNNINLDSIIGYHKGEKRYHFLDDYDEKATQ